ncbi:MAG TPA: PP2C family protein-serine/threonine phosphatase [Thermoanaerobaculia bacterium]|nr:PP2C family protein-serine/threonine phosphatase [Thermoanaerobaculia bacterium]
MRTSRHLLVWTLAGLAGVLLLVWAYPRSFPFLPETWSVNREEAAAIALERLTDLGDPVPDPYVVTAVNRDFFLERRLHLALDAGDSLERLQATGLPKRIVNWNVLVYSKTGLRDEWVYEASVSPSGEVLSLQLRLDPQAPGKTIAPQEARSRADAFLAQQGFDLSLYGEPRLRTRQFQARTDTAVRYPHKAGPPGGGSHGIAVQFSGDRLAGFFPWYEDPQERELQRSLQPAQFAELGRLLGAYFLAAVLGAPFLKRYHEGEIGVKRGVQIFAIVALAGLILTLLVARTTAQNVGFGVATRQQTTWLVAMITMVFWVLPFAVLAFVGWSVGESVCRERWGHKLAAFDALFQRQWGTATVARSALRGVAGGLALAGLTAVLLLALRLGSVSPLVSLFQSGDSRWPALELLAVFLTYGLPPILAVTLCLLPMIGKMVAKRISIPAGILVALAAGALVIFPAASVVPVRWGFLVGLLAALGPVLVFLLSDLLAALVTGMVSQVLLLGYPLLLSDDASLQAHGWVAVAFSMAPLILSIRSLGSGRELHYHYEDVPPHVRRIAERERQRVELETARRIQSAILPELPPSLYGVEISHAYLPASEVGGDFYDVLALEDGRLAIAVGDVAGHGVSSGLVMSMAKSALAVQVTFDPEVSAVFNTLNRTVFQTARKRLLATLCYALLDPQRRELVFASAGHLFPYRITTAGTVEALESIAYPLGVRGQLQVEPRTARLAPGDTLFLFSDGLVEARPEGSDQVYGFDRLEQSLARHAHNGVERLRDGVLEDLERYAGHGLREDDQTILVLRLP